MLIKIESLNGSIKKEWYNIIDKMNRLDNLNFWKNNLIILIIFQKFEFNLRICKVINMIK